MNNYKAPRGYALVSEDLLRIWGKLDELREICVYPLEKKEYSPVLVEAKHVVKYTENDGWGYDTWEQGFLSKENALKEVEQCNKGSHCIRAEYLGLKIIGQYDT